MSKISSVLFVLLGLCSAANARTFLNPLDLQAFSQAELDEIFIDGSADALPNGEAVGMALAAPSDFVGIVEAELAPFLWQGKVFNAQHGFLYNRVLGGLPAIPARIYLGESLFDEGQVVVVNYTGTKMRSIGPFDELRKIGPGIYLGRGYIPTLVGYFLASNFVLDFN